VGGKGKASKCSGNKNKLRTFAIILMKNWRISISSSILITNVCLICSASVAVSKKCYVD
jgi:hypothetical protein